MAQGLRRHARRGSDQNAEDLGPGFGGVEEPRKANEKDFASECTVQVTVCRIPTLSFSSLQSRLCVYIAECRYKATQNLLSWNFMVTYSVSPLLQLLALGIDCMLRPS